MIERDKAKRWFQTSIGGILTWTMVVAIGAGWYIDHERLAKRLDQTTRSLEIKQRELDNRLAVERISEELARTSELDHAQ